MTERTTRRWAPITGAMLVIVIAPVDADAGGRPPDDACLFLDLHTTDATYSGCESMDYIETLECEDFRGLDQPGGPLVWYWIIATWARGWTFDDGIGSIRFGLERSEDEPATWASCTAGADVPGVGWPSSGTGYEASWAGGCYVPSGPTARIGFLWPDEHSIDGLTGEYRFGVHPDDPGDLAHWRTCGGEERAMGFQPHWWYDLVELRHLCQLYTDPIGEPICSAFTPTAGASWGRIKSCYRTEPPLETR